MPILINLTFDLSQLIGLAASLLIGLSLGLIGGGGSILTVPVLVYLFGVDPVLATAYSLFIVGLTSAVGAFPKYQQGLVNLKTGLLFGAPSITMIFLTRKFIFPAIPAAIITGDDFTLTKSIFIMLLFSILMIAASISMIRNGRVQTKASVARTFSYPLIVAEGALVGLLAGFVGAGGGFLIIPALVLLAKLPMKEAIGTSLLIIAANSLIGFLGDLSHQKMDWTLLTLVTGIAMLGILIGNTLSNKIDGQKLKKGFGWFVLVMGIYILLKEGMSGSH